MAGLHAPMVDGGVERKEYILEANGCGCAFLDFDDDGWLDVFVLSGTRLEGPPVGATNRLYRNNRDGMLTDVTTAAGLEAVDWANNVCVGDFDNDGLDDIFYTYYGQNRLYRNQSDGTLRPRLGRGHAPARRRVNALPCVLRGERSRQRARRHNCRRA